MEEQLVVDFFDEEKKHWWHIAKRTLIKQFIKGEKLNIFVAGIGGGMICEELRSAGHHVVGMDISQASCEHVNKKIGISALNGNLENFLPFAKDSFDLVVIADVLEHLDNDKQLLSETFRCLKPSGAVMITVPAYSHMWSDWDIRLHHKRRYTLNMIKSQVVDVGFGIKKASYCHMLLYPFVYVYRKVLFLPKGECTKKSDFSICSNGITTTFVAIYYALERFLLNIINLPFGLSVFVIGTKHS